MIEKLSGSEFDMAFVPISLDDLETVVERNVCWLTADGVEFPWPEAGGYSVEWSRLKTQKHLLGWVAQLCTKRWMTGIRLNYFINQVCTHKGWVIHPLPV
jgi:hypothetical protein